MFRNYIKTALRHLQRSKLYTACNIAGLAIGICSCLLIGIYIWHELSYDRFHEKADRIARITWEYNHGHEATKTVTTGTKVGPEFTRRYPEIETYVRLLKYDRVVGSGDKMFNEKKFVYADSAFFTMFSFPLVKGDARTALAGPEKLVITETAAKKYFGSDDPIGKILKVGGNKDFLITGVAKDAPDNSQIKFDFIASFSTLNASKTEKWTEANYITYLLLKQPSVLPGLQSKINSYINEISKTELNLTGSQYNIYHLQPMTDVHLHSNLDGLEPNNNITYIYILGIVAILILMIACINYTNLATAQSASRSAEIGMRKVLGAAKKQVFLQFISESFLLTVFSVIVALALAIILLPYFNQLSGKEISPLIFSEPVTIICLLVLSIVVAVSSGAYPSLILSNTKLAGILKSGFSFTGSKGLRKSLIVFQFAISVFLIITTIIILQQLAYIRNKDLGYNREQVIVLPVDRLMSERYDDTKAAFASLPGVISAAGAYEEPVDIGWGDGITTRDNQQISVNAFPVDENIVKTLGLKLVAGHDFTLSDVKQFDTSDNGNNIRYSFMLNESAAKALGWKPEEAIGKTITKGYEGTVKAVVKDFHFHSLHQEISPLLIFLDKRLVSALFLKVSELNMPSTLDALANTWKQRIPHRPFEYHFLDEDYNNLYKTEQRTAGVFTAFSTIAILLACLGLFALTAYTMVQRTKEIGIRKVLGATLPNILSLVSKDFLMLVVIAMLIASPIAFYLVNKWLQDFTYKISVQWWVFAVAGILTLVIAFITISLQAVKIALANPVKSLRSE